DAVSQWLRQATRLDGEGQGLQGDAPTAQHEQLVRAGSSSSHRGLELELPAVRSQPEHGRKELRRVKAGRRAQCHPSLDGVSVRGDGDSCEKAAAVRVVLLVRSLYRDALRTAGRRGRGGAENAEGATGGRNSVRFDHRPKVNNSRWDLCSESLGHETPMALRRI